MQFATPSFSTYVPVPLFNSIQAGFPSPAQEFADRTIDLNEHIIKHPGSTFFARVEGESMIEKGIFPGDLLIIDKSLIPRQGDIIVAALNGEFTLKMFRINNGKISLIAANKNFQDIQIHDHDEFEVWGVVISALHKYI